MTKSKVKAVTALVEIKRSNVYSALKLIKMILGVDIKATPNDIEWLSGRCITAKYRNSTNIKSGYKFDICGNMTVLSNIFKLFSAQADAETALTDEATTSPVSIIGKVKIRPLRGSLFYVIMRPIFPFGRYFYAL